MAGSIPNNNYEDYDYLETLKSGEMTPNASASSGAGLNYGSMARSMSTAITTTIGVVGALEDLEAENQATKDSMTSVVESSKFKQNQQAQQVKDLERITGDKLTASGLEELKAESRLKAGQAETGGTASADVTSTTGMNKLHRDAVIKREGEVAVNNAMSSMVSTRLNLDNQLTAMASRTQSPLKGFLGTMNAGISGFNTGINYMNTQEREAMFGIDPEYSQA